MKIKNVILVLAFSFILSFSLSAQTEPCKASKQAEVTILTNMHCHTCKNKIESELGYEKGVKEVKADMATNSVTVIYNPRKTNPEKFIVCLQNAGYQAKVATTCNNGKSCSKSCSGKHEEHNHGEKVAVRIKSSLK